MILSCLMQLCKQEKLLADWGADLFCQGVNSMEELEAANASVLEEQLLAGSAQALGAVGVVDWSCLDFLVLSLLLADLGSSSDTAKVLAGSSGGAS